MPKGQMETGASSEELSGATQTAVTEKAPENLDGQPNKDGGTAVKDKPSKSLTLVRFLQEKPQSSGIRALLNAEYRMAVKTMAEWETTLADLLNKKTK